MKKSMASKKILQFENPDKKKKGKSIDQTLGSARGIESMFRNSYRAQLDMIALAATKANIMISLNGFLVSVLLVSGAYVLISEPLLLVPVTAFLLTCTTSIVFAVLAARPAIDRSVNSLEAFKTDKADLLIFSQFAKLPRDEFLDAITEMMQDNKRIYKHMTVHIYHLGQVADRKFSLLYISYSAFMIGLVISVGSLMLIVLHHAIFGT